MKLFAKVLIFIPLFLILYIAGKYFISDLFNFGNRLYQNLFDVIYIVLSILVSLIFSNIIVDKLNNKR